MIKHTLYGPPGTGKTSSLLDLLETELQLISSNKIAFVSYTKKGTYEGVHRAIKKFDLKEKDLMFFRTIHSLCFKAIGVKRYDMIDKKHYKLLSESTGINFTGYYTEDFNSVNDEYLHIVAMENHNKELAFNLSKHLNEEKLHYIRYQYGAMKKQLGILDFDDLLLSYLEYGKPLNVTTAFIDEAQDLTPLQWQVVYKLFANCEKIIIAGDDDQAVYEWSGADVTQFLRFSKEHTILNKSYRMPDKILAISKKITNDIRVRQTKECQSNGEEGVIDVHRKMSEMNFKGGELLLARTNYILRGLSFKLEDQGILYELKGKPSINKTVLNAIECFNRVQNKEIPSKEFMPYRGMFKNNFENLKWHEAIVMPKHQVAYYERVLANGTYNNTPVHLETFHSAKGSEADKVIISTDITTKVHENFNRNLDSELRCLYVGVTRAKKNLTILLPVGKDYYPQHYFNARC